MTDANPFGPQQSETEGTSPEITTGEDESAAAPPNGFPTIHPAGGELGDLLRSAGVSVANSDRSIVVVAGGDVGPVNMHSKLIKEDTAMTSDSATGPRPSKRLSRSRRKPWTTSWWAGLGHMPATDRRGLLQQLTSRAP